MPGAAHHGDAGESLLLRRADRLPHPRFTLCFPRIATAQAIGAQLRHRLLQHGKELARVRARFHLRFPPALPIGIAGHTREHGQRIIGLRFRQRRVVSLGQCDRRRLLRRRFLRHPHRQLMRTGQVDEADRELMREGKLQRLPFRREDGKGVESRLPRIVRHVEQQRHRRLHLRTSGERQHFRRLGRSFDEHDLRRDPSNACSTVCADPGP